MITIQKKNNLIIVAVIGEFTLTDYKEIRELLHLSVLYLVKTHLKQHAHELFIKAKVVVSYSPYQKPTPRLHHSC